MNSVDERARISYEKAGETPIAPDEYPLFFLTFKFQTAGILVDRPLGDWDYDVFCLVDGEEFRKFAASDKTGFRLGPGAWQPFCALLAKIAHAYAAGELGLKAFIPFLAGFIRNQPTYPFHFIGGEQEIPPPTEALHEIGLQLREVHGRKFVLVNLRLFACLGTPQYHIVVGELQPTFDQAALLQKPLYQIEIKTPIPIGKFVPSILAGVGRTWR